MLFVVLCVLSDDYYPEYDGTMPPKRNAPQTEVQNSLQPQKPPQLQGPSSKLGSARSRDSALIRAVKEDNKKLVLELVRNEKQDINAIFDNTKVQQGSKSK